MKKKSWDNHTDYTPPSGIGEILIQTNTPVVHRNNLDRLAKVVAAAVENSLPPIRTARKTLILASSKPLDSFKSPDEKASIQYSHLRDNDNMVVIYTEAFDGDNSAISAVQSIIKDTSSLVRSRQ